MGQNQHFVPEFYFRLFSTRENAIAMLFKRTGRLVDTASIDSQCARPNFYGSPEVESVLSRIESAHACALRMLIDFSWRDISRFREISLVDIWQSVLLQRSRTELDVLQSAKNAEQLALEMFTHFITNAPDINNGARMLEAVAAGQVGFQKDPAFTAREKIDDALRSTLLISDLDFCVLRNLTDYPFIFGDAPVVFFNTYAYAVRNRGVLGLQCPGLQIFYPLNPSTLLMFYDDKKYRGPFLNSFAFDITRRSDVSQLNMLQLHHSHGTLYVGDPNHLPYVGDLWNAAGRSSKPPEHALDRDSPLWVDGKPPDGRLIHLFEKQLDYPLNLSFVETTPVRERDYVYSPRSPELREEARAADEQRMKEKK